MFMKEDFRGPFGEILLFLDELCQTTYITVSMDDTFVVVIV
jgi:hypothetical protein